MDKIFYDTGTVIAMVKYKEKRNKVQSNFVIHTIRSKYTYG